MFLQIPALNFQVKASQILRKTEKKSHVEAKPFSFSFHMLYVCVLFILTFGIILCFVCFDSCNRCVKQTVSAEYDGRRSSNVESLDPLCGCTNCAINSLCMHEHDVTGIAYLLSVQLPCCGDLPCCWWGHLPCWWGHLPRFWGYVPCCWGHLPCCWGYSTCSWGEPNCDHNAHGLSYIWTCDYENVTACTMQKLVSYTVLQNDMNFTDLAITVSAIHEPHHGHVTSNCHRYYGIMRHYQMVFEMHINTRSHQRRQWFSCTLRHLLRRRRHCRRNFRLANALSLLLLLGGDIELNPGPRQDVMHHDTSMSIPGPNVISVAELNETERHGIKETEAKKQARLAMSSACQRK